MPKQKTYSAENKDMNGTLTFNPNEYPASVVRLIMAKAEAERCSPSDAVAMLLSELASRAGFTAEVPVDPDADADLRRRNPVIVPDRRPDGKEAA